MIVDTYVARLVASFVKFTCNVVPNNNDRVRLAMHNTIWVS